MMSGIVVISSSLIVDSAPVNEIAHFLSTRAGVSVLFVPPFYHLPEASPVWDTLRALPAGFIVLAEMHPRATMWVLRKHGISAKECLDLRRDDIAESLANMLGSGGTCEGSVLKVADDIKERWYPVLDSERCKQCGHCKQFCLFGVYSVDDEGRIFVDNPDSCKPGCPACSRICPHGAIIFPLFVKEPAIAGAPGQFTVVDLAARKLFYQRTKLLCPVCGIAGSQSSDIRGVQCEECGRIVPAAASTAPNDVLDELDSLVDALERLPKRRP